MYAWNFNLLSSFWRYAIFIFFALFLHGKHSVHDCSSFLWPWPTNIIIISLLSIHIREDYNEFAPFSTLFM